MIFRSCILCTLSLKISDFDKVPEQQLILYAQMANLIKSLYREEDVEIKEITQTFCRVCKSLTQDLLTSVKFLMDIKI